ncbi:hypothetical protein BJ875DRAFT_502207 [Amylocarpus encephaloides]|uniref:Uncharacterized protein n=1 Tax=Amylocarpus encephaloides TaxID=45428 RepID=A0A9P8C8X7_9HELO|nr:hypothetical protein BJ875DRAFT_502207 [Amylocarpus encephaloides]
MEVGTSPLKWRDLEQSHIDERAMRTNVAILEFSASGTSPEMEILRNSADLRRRLGETDLIQDPSYARLFIVEDLSRDVIEALGFKYDIDPLYFRSQISDYLWHKTSDPWVELHDLPHVASERNHYNMRYMRPRYFELEDSLKVAKTQLGEFNVLRRLDEDLSWYVRKKKKTFGPTVGLVRSKTSLWIRDKSVGQGVIGILVVDPTLKHGHPLWGGPRNLKPCPSVRTNHTKFTPRKTLFEDVCYYACTMSQDEIKAIREQPLAMALPIISLVAAEWMSVVSYIISGLTDIEKLARSSTSPSSSDSCLLNDA